MAMSTQMTDIAIDFGMGPSFYADEKGRILERARPNRQPGCLFRRVKREFLDRGRLLIAEWVRSPYRKTGYDKSASTGFCSHCHVFCGLVF